MARRSEDNPNWGGKRRGAGRNRQRLLLSKEAAKSLYILTKHRRALFNKPELTEEDVVSDLIAAGWHELDEHYQEASLEAE